MDVPTLVWRSAFKHILSIRRQEIAMVGFASEQGTFENGGLKSEDGGEIE